MAEEARTTTRRRRSLSWPVVLVAAVVLLVVAVVFGLPLLARPVLERQLRAALQAPVAIGTLSWNPFRGVVSAAAVAIGGEQEKITAKSLSVGADLGALLRGDIALDRIELDGLVTEIRLDENFRPILGSLLGRAGGEAGGSSPAPHVAIRELVLSDGQVKIHYPLAEGRSRDTVLEIQRLAATNVDIDQTAGGVSVKTAARFDGMLDGAAVRGEAQVLVTGDESQAGVEIAVSGIALSRDILPLATTFPDFQGKLEGRAKYSFSGKPARQELDLDLNVTEARLESGSGVEVTASVVSLPKVRVDLLKQRVDLGAVTVEAPVATVLLDRDLAAPSAPAAKPTSPPSSWKVTSGPLQLKSGRVLLKRGESTAAIAIASARWEGLKSDGAGALVAKLTVEGGGSADIEGTFAADPLAMKLDVGLDEVPLAFLGPYVDGVPLAFSKGTLGGTVALDYGDGRLRRLSGKLEAQHVHTAPPQASRPGEVLAVHAAEVEFTLSATTPPMIDITSLVLHYPYVMVQRNDDGVFPVAAFTAAPAPPPTQEAGAKEGATAIRVRHLEIESGKLEFVDDTLQPPFWTSLTDVNAKADEIRLPEATVEGFEISGMQDELSPAKVSGMLTSRGFEGHGEIQNIRLEALNAYVSPVLGYEITSGGLSSTATAVPAPPLLESTVDVVLVGVDVQQTGRDVIQEQSGVPLPIALGLIANTSGEIRLTLPFFVDPQARKIELGSILWQAVRSAIVGALTSPLRLLGSLFGTRGAPHAFAVDPIPFAVGSASLDRAGERRVEQIGRILQSHRSLLLVLLPQITAADVHEVGAGGEAALAAKRNAAVRDALTGLLASPRLEASRLMLVEWQPKVGAEATGKPGVYVELQDAP